MRLNILLLCNRPVKNADASTVTDHLDAFTNFSKHKVTQLSFLRDLPKKVDLNRFDAIVIHYSIAIGYLSHHYISETTKQLLREYEGLKIVFIQDEYRSVNAVLEALSFIKADVLFTCVPEGEIDKVYLPDTLPHIVKINTLTGYVPKALTKQGVPRIASRPIDVGYRTRKPPFWLGELGYEKWQIADAFKEAVRDSGLKLDISYNEADRIYGEQWIDFVSSCKAMLGVESGASVFDFEGSLQKTVDAYVEEHPEADFHEVQKKFLMPYEGKIRLNQISPRCFEAAALRTVLVLYEGDYSGKLVPWRHYIPLKKDLSNMTDVLAVLQNNDRLQEIADNTFNEVALNPENSYEYFITQFDSAVESCFIQAGRKPVGRPYSNAGYKLAILASFRYSSRQLFSRMLQRLILGTGLRKWVFRLWGNIPLNTRNIIRPLLRMVGR